jgi:CBS domain containing-hemolysin-like protein
MERLVTVGSGVTPREIEQLTAGTGFSRFPVKSDSGDLIGYLHLKDVLETGRVERTSAVPAKRIRPLLRVGVDDSLGSVLATMQSNGAHLARATDAEGKLLGVVALEDVIAELIGAAAV